MAVMAVMAVMAMAETYMVMVAMMVAMAVVVALHWWKQVVLVAITLRAQEGFQGSPYW